MKRFLSLMLIAAILLTVMMVGVVGASAQAFDTAIVVGSTTYVADVGETFTYTVNVTSSNAVSAGQIEIPVDFTYLSGESEDALNAKIDDIAPVVADTAQIYRFDEASESGLTGYVFNFASDGSYDFTAGSKALTLSFTVLKAGTISLNPTFREFLDDDCGDIVSLDGEINGDFKSSVAVDLPKNNVNALKTPRINSISSVSDGLRIEWSAIENAPKYRLFRNNGTSWVAIADVTEPAFVDTDVVSGESYLYTVRVIDANGNAKSNFVNCGWSGTYVAEPAIASFESIDSGLKMTWNAAAGASAYRVYRKSGNNWVALGNVTNCSYVDYNVIAGTSYTYAVSALDQKSREISSHSETGFTSYYLGAPVLKSVANGSGCVTITWDKMNGAAKYRVFRKNVDENTGWFEIGDTTALTYDDKVVTSGKTYTYTVRCVTASGSAFASPFDSTGLTIQYIAPPAVPTVTNINGGITVTWKAVAGAAKYRLYRKVGNGSWAKLVDTTALTYTDKKVTTGTAYSYTVRCLNSTATAFTSAYNTTGTKITYLAPPTPKAATNANGFVQFTWAKRAGAAQYRVYRKTGSGAFVMLGNTKNLYWNDKKVASGTTYTYVVRCLSSNGKVLTSAYVTGKTVKYIAPPTLKKVAKSGKTVKFTWAKPKGAVKFRVYRKTGNGKWVNLGYTASTTWTDKTVKSGYKYTYTVCCVSSNGKTVQSAYNPTGKAITYR